MMKSLSTLIIPTITSITLLMVFVLIGKYSHAQDASEDLKQRLTKYKRDVLHEKAYVHTDKEFYVAGELLWMKAYVVDAHSHIPSNISKVGYAELINADQKAVLQAKFELSEGKGAGSLYLPPTLASGNYHLRFYTNWMKNFPAEKFFEKQVSIVNTLRAGTASGIKDSSAIFFRFFPEGGALVDELPAKVGFIAEDAFGNAILTTAAIVSKDNDTVARISSNKHGMGSFVFTPRSEKNYRIISLAAPQNSSVKMEFPEISSSGYTMQLSRTGNRLKVVIQAKSLQGENKIPVVYLLAHSGKDVTHASMQNIASGTATFETDASILRSGVNYFTVFDYTKKPVAERLYFNKPSTRLEPEIVIQGNSFKTREKVPITISGKNAEGVEADYSYSVYKVADSSTIPSNDIHSYLHLQSELGNFALFPSISLSKEFTSEDDLDLLMLTRGWRNFSNSDEYANSKPLFKYLPELDGHLLTAKVVDSRTGKPQRQVNAYLSIPGANPVFLAGTSDSSGNVQFNMKNHHGPGELILQTDYARDSVYRVELESPFFNGFPGRAVRQLRLSPNHSEYLKSLHLGVQVQSNFASGQMRTFVEPLLDSTPFFRSPDFTYYLDDYKRFTTMEEVLREYVPGVIVRKREGRFKVEMISSLRKEVLPDPLILIDGVPVFSSEQVLAYDPLKVRKLQVVMKRYYYGAAMFTGITSFTTYNGDLAGFTPDPRAVVLDYEGLQLQRKFYSPVYETDQQRKSRTPDYRTVLHWSPFNMLTSGGSLTSEFYTSDQTGHYVIVVHGLSKSGISGSAIRRFEVRD